MSSPEVIPLEGFDDFARREGVCGVRAYVKYRTYSTVATCDLAPDHDGPHTWEGQ